MPIGTVGFSLLVFAGFVAFTMMIDGLFGSDGATATTTTAALPEAVAPCPSEQVEKFVYGGFSVPEIINYCPEKSGDPKVLRAAATSGNWGAAAKLGQLYRDGREVAADPVEAYAWLSYATKLEDRAELRDAVAALARTMDPSETARAERRLASLTRAAAAEGGTATARAPSTGLPSVVVLPPVIGPSYPWAGRYPPRRVYGYPSRAYPRTGPWRRSPGGVTFRFGQGRR